MLTLPCQMNPLQQGAPWPVEHMHSVVTARICSQEAAAMQEVMQEVVENRDIGGLCGGVAAHLFRIKLREQPPVPLSIICL